MHSFWHSRNLISLIALSANFLRIWQLSFCVSVVRNKIGSVWTSVVQRRSESIFLLVLVIDFQIPISFVIPVRWAARSLLSLLPRRLYILNHNTFFRFACSNWVSSDCLSVVVGNWSHFWTRTKKLSPLMLLMVSSSLLIIKLSIFGWHSARNHLVFFLSARRSSITLRTSTVFNFTAPWIIFDTSSCSGVSWLLPTMVLENKLILYGCLESISFDCSLVKDQISPSFSGSQRLLVVLALNFCWIKGVGDSLRKWGFFGGLRLRKSHNILPICFAIWISDTRFAFMLPSVSFRRTCIGWGVSWLWRIPILARSCRILAFSRHCTALQLLCHNWLNILRSVTQFVSVALLSIFLEQEVIRCRQMVMFVILNRLLNSCGAES